MTRREEITNNIGYQMTHAAIEYIQAHEYADRIDSFEAGAEWANKTMIEKACEWVENHIFDFPWYDNEHGDFSSKDVANALRKAMEE